MSENIENQVRASQDATVGSASLYSETQGFPPFTADVVKSRKYILGRMIGSDDMDNYTFMLYALIIVAVMLAVVDTIYRIS